MVHESCTTLIYSFLHLFFHKSSVAFFIMSDEQITDHRENTQPNSLALLHDQLDALWIRYLNLLDEYTNAQASIKRHMSSGFFALAQANFKSSRGRYGQDHYDERAVAITGVHIDTKDDGVSLKIAKRNITTEEGHTEEAPRRSSSTDVKQDTRDPSKSEPIQLPSPEATPEPESKQDRTTPGADMNTASAPDEEKPKPQSNVHDPIRWFGILVPSTLREAQKSFSTAVLDQESLTKAVNCSRGLREVEVEIRKLRKAIRKVDKKLSEAPVAGVVPTVA